MTTVPPSASEIVQSADTFLPYAVLLVGAVVSLLTAWWVRTTRKTLTPNGNLPLDDGGSLFDAINRIEKAATLAREEARLTREQAELTDRRLLRTEEKVDQLVEAMNPPTSARARAPRKARS